MHVKKVASQFRSCDKIKCIASNEEKYISFSKTIVVGSYMDQKKQKKVKITRQIRFIDSFKFMASSLADLVKNLEPKDCNILYENFGNNLNLVLRKGVYPYDYMNDLEKFKETKLPPIEDFYSKLYECGISEEDYKHAQNVWKTFKMKTMRDYHDLYLKTDVLQLADVFENFRKICQKNYNLDPAWYYTTPGLAWDALLKFTNIKLELLADYDMVLMIEKGTRGGISSAITRYSEANNKYMADYDPAKPSKFIQYLDANNLYGYAMSKPLPTHGFKWMEKSELENWKNISCILEVDLEYPDELHNLHNEYPLAPEKLKINGVEKLIPNLGDKKNYVLHCESLKLYED